ncbi:MAG: DUF975 family protein [Clostridiales bacterium]|nr:DUF975 family protein [Clostridiales bacterium]
MWTRKELKTKAKSDLKAYYWKAFLVSLIVTLVNRIFNGNGDVEMPDNISDIPAIASKILPVDAGELQYGVIIMGLMAGTVLVIAVVCVLINALLRPALTVGKNRFYLEGQQTGKENPVSLLGWGFRHNYINLVLTFLLRDVLVMIGTVCLVIPGIYLHYCYYMAFYILAENPDMKPMDALRLSKEMMKGHKWNLFVLRLSFIGWDILGTITLGIGGLFIQPYKEATFARLYTTLRSQFAGSLNGFETETSQEAG